MFWQNSVLLLIFLSLFGEPILTTVCFYLYIGSALNIYCINQRRMYLWKHKRKILFIVTRLELTVSFTEELSVAEFSGSHFQYAPKWQRTVRMKLFLKLCGIQENLVPFKNGNLYLLESEHLAKCVFNKNLIDGTTIEKNNMKPMNDWKHKSILYFLFYFILFLKRLWKNALAFCSQPLTLLLKLRESDVPTRN